MCKGFNYPVGCNSERSSLSITSGQKERFVTTLIKASVLSPGLFSLRQYVKGKHNNGAYFHSPNATANLVCHHKPPMSLLSENAV